MVLREFMRRDVSASQLEKINNAHREPDPEDEHLIEGAKRHSERLLDE